MAPKKITRSKPLSPQQKISKGKKEAKKDRQKSKVRDDKITKSGKKGAS
jgi:hypothetical protein